MGLITFIDSLRTDIRFAFRTMRKSPVSAATAILTLALGIGANTAIFSLVHAVLLKPLEYRDPDRLVRISGGATAARYEAIGQAGSFAGTGAFNVFTEYVALSGPDGPEALKSVRVSANFLAILGITPIHGRSFVKEEEGGAEVAMISAELWRRRFGGDPRVVGGTVRLAGSAYTIAGVLPPGFQFPEAGIDIWRPWQPSTMSAQSRINSPVLSIFGRLKPRVTLEQASAEVTVINRQYTEANPGLLDARRNVAARVTPLKEELVKDVRSMLWMLFGAVGFVLLIACANIASLLLARANARSREFAIRAALGVGRGRLVRQLLVESLVLAAFGGTMGVLLANWSLNGLKQLPGLELPRAGEVQLDGAVLGFAVVLSMATSLLFGLAPSLAASRTNLAGVITKGPRRLRTVLVAGQVALSMVLLIGAALMIESLAGLQRVDPGFQPANLLTMQVALPQGRYDSTTKSAAFFEEFVRRVEAVPGVRAAAVMLTLPMTGYAGTPVQAVGMAPLRLNERPIAVLQITTPGYFRTLEIPVRRGRDFAPQDNEKTQPVAIISERLARRFWPAYPGGEDPVGRAILVGASPQPVQVVGIAADIRQRGLAEEADLALYRPRAQASYASAMVAVRTIGDPLRLAQTIRQTVATIDPDQAIANVNTMESIVDSSEGRRQSVMILLALFAMAGLLLACVGIYGVVAYSVEQRKKEMGIRSALGAGRGHILRLILGQGMGLAAAGVVLGIGMALGLNRVIRSLLFGVSSSDPATFAGIGLLLLSAAFAASYIPARRATTADPVAALRAD